MTLHVCHYCLYPVTSHQEWCPYSETKTYPGSMIGQFVTYEWPNDKTYTAVIVSEPDENGQIGIHVLAETQRVDVADVRSVNQNEEQPDG